MAYHVFYDVDPSTVVGGLNGTPITPVTAASLVQTNSDYHLVSTDANCTCSAVETWLVYSGSNPSPSVTVGTDIILGVVYGPVPPVPPKKP